MLLILSMLVRKNLVWSSPKKCVGQTECQKNTLQSLDLRSIHIIFFERFEIRIN